ncbi:MAG: pyridoxine 5'-phosphate synthase [Pseudomonadales bacterium]|nr:pyridoxine 5'-phosphate synthase [Pseudomonadales bacterium]NIX06544.1 pyridoxine 5'-phosphate synthase [Pseudomonadales bacterium]
MAVLSVNLNKVALLRNARGADQPSVTGAARTVLAAGAHGITVHPRPDQRHVRPDDVSELATLLQTYPGIEYNIEGNPFAGPRDNGYPGFDALIESAQPHQATLVPDTDNQLTSDHGWDLAGDNRRLSESIKRYQAAGARVSLFMDPEHDQIARARDVGADRIELYTGPFAETVSEFGLDDDASRASLARYEEAAAHAAGLGLGVNAGHDLDTHNLKLFRQIEQVAEVSIGHALISDALDVGLTAAVRAYLEVLGHL